MKFRNGIITATALAMVVAATVSVQAMGFRRGTGPRSILGPGLHRLKAFLELKLSDSQEATMLSIIEKYEKDKAIIKESLATARKNLATALEADQLNEDEIRTAFGQTIPFREELLILRARTMTELKGVLTSEQLQMLKNREMEMVGTSKTHFRP